MGYTVVAITNEWDMFMRRYRSLFTELEKYDDIDHILYVETPLTLYSFIRFLFGRMNRRDRERWSRVLKKGVVHREGKIFIVTPVVPFPFLSINALLRFNVFWLNELQLHLIRKLKTKLGFEDVILWINHPYFPSKLVRKVTKKLFCYDLCDDYNAKEKDAASLIAKLIRENDAYLTEQADIMFVSSEKLFEERSPVNKNVHRVPNGVHMDFIRRRLHSVREPADLKHVPGPRLIYIGNISEAVDLELLQWLGKARPGWSIVMIGPVRGRALERELRKINSVHLMGVRSYEESIAYLKFSDVAVIPYKRSPWALSIDSLKIYNYIASGKPVVSTEIGGSEAFRGIISIGKDRDDFVRQIEAALNETGEEGARREKLQCEVLAGHTWRKRAETIHDLMLKQLNL